ncbi:MAG: DUF2283 domain-containing protein [Halobacteriota archaeon]
MKISYDEEADALYIKFRDGEYVESDEVQDGIILDYDGGRNLIAIEILNASSRFTLQDLTNVSFELQSGKAANRVLQMGGLEVRKAGDIEVHLIYVDEGEAEALDLAKSLGAGYLVCDDYESFWYLTERF